VFVCPRAYLWNYTSDLRQIFVDTTYGRGSVLLWRHSDTLRSVQPTVPVHSYEPGGPVTPFRCVPKHWNHWLGELIECSAANEPIPIASTAIIYELVVYMVGAFEPTQEQVAAEMQLVRQRAADEQRLRTVHQQQQHDLQQRAGDLAVLQQRSQLQHRRQVLAG